MKWVSVYNLPSPLMYYVQSFQRRNSLWKLQFQSTEVALFTRLSPSWSTWTLLLVSCHCTRRGRPDVAVICLLCETWHIHARVLTTSFRKWWCGILGLAWPPPSSCPPDPDVLETSTITGLPAQVILGFTQCRASLPGSSLGSSPLSPSQWSFAPAEQA